MTVALGVREHAVAVEDQRGHVAQPTDADSALARPADPNMPMWYSAICLTAVLT